MVVMIRHGDTKLNDPKKELLRGWLDVPLTDEGMHVAQEAAEKLRDMPVHKIYASDLNRAVQTAQEIGGRLDKEVEFLGAFRPWNLGIMTGEPVLEILDEMFYYIDHPDKKVPEGESFNTFKDRFLMAFKPLVNDPRMFVLVTHSRNIMLTQAVSRSQGKTLEEGPLKHKCEVDPGGFLVVDRDWTYEVVNPPPTDELITRPHRISKGAVLYLHLEGTDYKCEDCFLYLSDTSRCILHGKDDLIQSYGSCGLFIAGTPMTSAQAHPVGLYTKDRSGYAESKPGFGCQRCEYFLPDRKDCLKVDPESDGDDPGWIDPHACCNAWSSKEKSS